MGVRKQFERIQSWWRRPLRTPALDIVLAEAVPSARLEERTQWLCDLLQWIRHSPEVPNESDNDPGKLAAARVRFLLQVLDRNPEQKERVAKTLRSVLRDSSALDLFCEAGLPREHGFLSEAAERITAKLLPQEPYAGELGALFERLFPHGDDPHWVGRLDDATLQRIHDLLRHEHLAEEPEWNLLLADMEEALAQLAAQIRIVGSSQPIRTRIGTTSFRELPFFRLTTAMEAVLKAHRENPDQKPAAELGHLHQQMQSCRQAIDTAYGHLEEYGVSSDIVYQLDRLRSQLQRMDTLLELLLDHALPLFRIAAFIAELIAQHQERQGVRSLVQANLALLTRKMVERNASTGEHYIARDRTQYNTMVKQAAGGGAIMALTTWLKFGLLAIPFAKLIEGLALSLNYAGTFVAIQLAHFSLATKQPANTAPALAARMHDVSDPLALESLVDEVVCLIRSQVASIVGNIALVFPVALLIAWIGNEMTLHPLITEAKAGKLIHGFSLFSMTPVYAAFTGVLLWFSSLLGGFADNWFAFHRLQEGIGNSSRLQWLLGPGRVQRLAVFLDDNISGFASNISLGFMLGLIPVIGELLGLPIDVRHVTLSSGQLAAALFTVGITALHTLDFWLAVCGVASVGFINVGSSFALAMWVAIRARGVQAPERSAIYQALWNRFRRAPFTFFWPGPETVVPTGPA